MVPLYSNKITRVPLYSKTTLNITPTGLSPSMVSFSKLFRLSQYCYWPIPRSLATTSGITFVFFSSRYLDVSVPWVCLLNGYYIFNIVGFPIRKFSDQSPHTAPRNLSQYTTSFIAFQCLGIRHTPLNA